MPLVAARPAAATSRRRARSALEAAWMLLCIIAVVLPGCGYTGGGTYPAAYRTVAVPIFENHTFHRRVENELAEALVKQIEQRTPYKVTDAGSADTILEGGIRQIDQVMVARHRPGGLPEEMEVTIVVDFAWRDQRTGETLRQREGFEAVGRYAPARPVGQRFESAQHQAVQRLAEDMVATMQASW
ncbi:MAG: LptE family protein [Phycisphaeraceae bacterium]